MLAPLSATEAMAKNKNPILPLLSAAVLSLPCPALSEPAYVTRVSDGDTVKARTADGRELKIRIIGIDTPEKFATRTGSAECFGEEASAFAKSVLQGKRVELESDPTQDRKDRYGRTLAHVYVGGELYAALAARGGYGLAYVFKRPSLRTAEIAAAENAGRKAGAGLWTACPEEAAARYGRGR